MARKNINIRAGYDLAFFSDSAQNLAREMRKSGRKMQSIGKSLSMSLTAPIAIMGGLAVKTFADFQQSMAKVAAISGASDTALKKLESTAKQLGITTRFSATEVSQLMLNYSKLGFSSEEIDKITSSTLNLALATGEDLAESATMAGGMLRAYKIDAQDVSKVTDTMALAFSSSSLDLEKFKVSMPKVAAVSNALGFSFQRTTAMISTLVSGTHEASTSGTMLRNMMLKAKKEGFSFDGAIQAIANSSDKGAKAMEFFDDRAVGVAITLAENIDLTNQLTKEYMASGGTAKAMADIMDNTLEGAMKRLNSATEGLAIEFGQIMAPAIGKVADLLASFALMMSKLPKPVKTVITVVAGLTAIIGPLIFVLGGLKVALATITTSVLIIAAKIVLVIAVIAGLALVYQYVRDNSEAFATFFKNLWVKIVNSVIDSIKGLAKGLTWLAGKFGVDIGIDAFFDQFKLKKVKAEKEFKSFGDTVKKVKETVSKFTLEDVEEEEGGGPKETEKLLSPKEATKKVSTLKAEINDIMKRFQPEIIPVVNVDKIEEGLNKPEVKSKLKKMGEDLSQSFNQGLQSLIQKGVSDLGKFFGDTFTSGAMMSDQLKQTEDHYNKLIEAARQNGEDITKIEEEKAQKIAEIQKGFSMKSRVEDFGRGLLDAIGGFMTQFGEAMIAFGLKLKMMNVAIATNNPGLAIAAGIALVAAGTAISNLSKKGMGSETTGGSSPSPTGGGMGTMALQPITLETKISGRDLILVQNREKGFSR